VGSVHLPNPLYHALKASPLVLLEASVEERVAITRHEYIDEALAEYRAVHGDDEGFEKWAEYLLDSLDRIQRRLGGVRHHALRSAMDAAISVHRDHGDTALHRYWIERLLVDYYDPMYDYQIEKNAGHIAFQGDAEAVLDYLTQTTEAARKPD
jgi:tRNA 2-selenouridine synthase